ncbi:hypothetical protein CALK_2355 [Chitinivibrio alkaliphilus ACht1]|uniref:Uncharacterized protein n=1 Tax=Chitinivibrio alkaliphilus ACht1 TaxID=1313304 RepID=U7D2Q0_9BACT|nr:hypothetical protein CALK_2355 [Chitinivibrio alkaliphilus ACht1]
MHEKYIVSPPNAYLLFTLLSFVKKDFYLFLLFSDYNEGKHGGITGS